MFTWVRYYLVRVWVKCHEYGYRYESCMSRSHRYGSETMGRGTNFCIQISMGIGLGKGTTCLLSVVQGNRAGLINGRL